MGLYRLEDLDGNNYPIYKKLDGDQFIYVDSYGGWAVMNERHPTHRALRHTQNNPTPTAPPTTGWEYWDGSSFRSDNTLTVQSVFIGNEITGGPKLKALGVPFCTQMLGSTWKYSYFRCTLHVRDFFCWCS